MEAISSPSPSAGQRRGGHLKRLSLSVGGGQLDMMNSKSSSSFTPERATAAVHTPSRESSMSPLHRSLGSGSSRRQRPMSMYAAGSSLSSPRTSLLDNTLSPSSPSSMASTSNANMPSDHDRDQSLNAITEDGNSNEDASNSTIPHPLAGTPTHEASMTSPSSSIASPSGSNPLRNSTGRRSILGRSAHARRQSSISYARSPSHDSPSSYASPSIVGSGGLGTPRTSLSAIRDEDEDGSGHTDMARPASHQTPSRTSIDSRTRADSIDNHSVVSDTMSTSQQQSLLGTSPSSINEMNIGPGTRSSDLLTFIAKKERRCLDLREGKQFSTCCETSL